MTSVPHKLSERLLNLASAIAPSHRQEWIRAMRAELGPAGDARLSWAFGCLLTAINQRLFCAVRGTWGRLTLGLFLALIGYGFMVRLIAAGMPREYHTAADLGDQLAYWLVVAQCGGVLILSTLDDRLALLGRRIFGLATLTVVIARPVNLAINHPAMAPAHPALQGLISLVLVGAFAAAGLTLLLDTRKLLRLFLPLGAAVIVAGAFETLRAIQMGITGWLLTGFVLLCAPYLLVMVIAHALALAPTRLGSRQAQT